MTIESAGAAQKKKQKQGTGYAVKHIAAWGLALLLAACGGGGDAGDAGDAPADGLQSTGHAGTVRALATTDNNGPGALRSVTPLGVVSPQAVLQVVTDARVPGIVPAYAVQTYRITYMSTDGQGQPLLVSGLMAVPMKGAGARSPVISYQHPTIFFDAQAPSNNPTATEPSVVMASMGYVVVAADYVGYGVSRGQPHPYLLSAPTAAAVVDLLRAGQTHALNTGLQLNGQLFLVGYSEGAYATVAAQRALQAMGGDIAAAVVGSAPGGGPLDVGATLDELLRRVRAQNSFLAALVNPNLLQNLGSDLRRQVRDEMLKLVIPDGADVVFQPTFIDNFLANDRGAINRDSDVHDWRPDTAVRLFHGPDDQTVPFLASQRALTAMQGRGAPDVQLRACTAVPSGHLDCVPEYWQFMLSQMAQVVRDL